MGLSAPLYDSAAILVRDARGLVAQCACTGGCPACVGPILAGDETRAITPRAAALAVLDLLDGAGEAPTRVGGQAGP